MNARNRLESNLISEAEAYGYTLSVWGAGALLIHAHGIPNVYEAVAYVLGAILGFGVLALAAFSDVTADARIEDAPSSMVASTLHLVATVGTLVAVDLVILATEEVRVPLVFFGAGVVVTVVYNVLLLLEEFVARTAVE